MDYVYAELNQKVIKNTYTGGHTTTADVTIDNSTGVIYVVAHADESYVIDKIQQALHKLNYEDVVTPRQFVTVVAQENGQISVSKRSIVLEDLPAIPITSITNLQETLRGKQGTVGFEGVYDKNTNKAITRTYLEQAIEPLKGGVFYLGVSLTEITQGSRITHIELEDHTEVDVIKGCVVTYNNKKWYFNGEQWSLFSDANVIVHITGGDITDSDIKSNADIAQSKVHGLTEINSKVNILVANEDTAGSVANKIKLAIEALDKAEVRVGTGEIIESIKEDDGIITVTKRTLTKQDIPTIDQSQVSGLPKKLEDIETAISEMDLEEVEFDTGKLLWKIKQEDGKITVVSRNITADDIPTLSYEKITGLSDVAHTGDYKDLTNRPTLTLNKGQHFLKITSTVSAGLWTQDIQ